ncbi:MAG: tRNA threonylcarbamoyladenosine dehydratase [Bacteroidales bacterium]|nr:tRNA threonylcarbamoyladenosine dehydratase [Bacteroidales bacterium]
MLLQPEGLERLRSAHVLVVGLGGVGGYAAEMLCRAGVGHLTIVDNDVVTPTNINRQIIALQSTVGQPKTELFNLRLHDINPDCEITVVQQFLRDELTSQILQQAKYDYVVDAIDTLAPKVFLLCEAHRLGLPVVSSMGSAGKLDPSAVHVADISRSHTCPLAAMVRKRLHRLGVHDGIKVVFSTEKVAEHAVVEDPSQNKRTTIGTISYLPPLFGCHCASVVIRDLISSK